MEHDKPKKILILFAHPSLHRSEINRHLKRQSERVDSVTMVDLYAEYPDYHIDIDREQKRLVEHDVIVFMFPLYWYSTPSILKEWQDLVLEYGFAYGHDGTALHGKKFLSVISAGGASDAYKTEGYNHFTVRQLLQPLEQTASLTGMIYLPPLVLFSARKARNDGRLSKHIKVWKHALEMLANDQLPINEVKDLNNLNLYMEPIVEELDQ